MELLDSLEDFDEDFSPHKTLERHPVVDAETTGGHRRGLGLLLKLLVITLLAGGGYAYYTHTFRDSGETPSAVFMPETPSPDTAERAASPAPVASDSMATAFPASGSDAATGVSPDMPDAAPVPSASVGPEVLPEPLSAPVVPSSALTETAPGVTQATGPEPGADLAPEGEAVPEIRSGSGKHPRLCRCRSGKSRRRRHDRQRYRAFRRVRGCSSGRDAPDCADGRSLVLGPRQRRQYRHPRVYPQGGGNLRHALQKVFDASPGQRRRGQRSSTTGGICPAPASRDR